MPIFKRTISDELIKATFYLSRSDKAKLKKAISFCESAHVGQFRKTGEPYSNHPINVALICAGWKLDVEALVAGLLHDTVEDTATSLNSISNLYGDKVAELVDGLSKVDQLVYRSFEEKTAENFRKMLLATAADARVILIKLADRLHNMQTLSALSKKKKRRISKETLEIFAPIAHRLGFNELYRKLEDLCFKNLYPKRYKVLNEAISKAKGNRREIISELQKKIVDHIPSFGVKGKVFGREKSLYSIYLKMKEKRVSFAEVFDIHGFRIIVKNLTECYLCLGALHKLFKPIPGRFKDYIALPKSNGYQSLHTVVMGPYGTPLELQIRTEKMHSLSEVGIASHWLYKKKEKDTSPLQFKTHEWMKSLLTVHKQTAGPSEFIDYLKIDLFPDVIYVFTPQGEIIELPRGSTPVDFAYSIHSDIGKKCTGAKINSQNVSLDTKLKNGDVVSVLQHPNAKPDPSWLNFVRTSKARAAIRNTLKKETHERVVAFGKKLMLHAIEALNEKIDFEKDIPWESLFAEISLNNREELFEKVGLGYLYAEAIAQRILILLKSKSLPAAFSSDVKQRIELSMQHLTDASKSISINGTEGPAVNYAVCCFPIPGDPAHGLLSGGKGLLVHRKTCAASNKQRNNDPARWSDILWEEINDKQFICYLLLEVEESPGVLAKIASAISITKSNIVDVSINRHKGSFFCTLKIGLEISHRVHLAEVLRNIRKVSALAKVTRLTKS